MWERPSGTSPSLVVRNRMMLDVESEVTDAGLGGLSTQKEAGEKLILPGGEKMGRKEVLGHVMSWERSVARREKSPDV